MLRCFVQCSHRLETLSGTVLSKQPEILYQQTRNTYVLKRRHPTLLYKKNQKLRKLTNKYFIYDEIQDTHKIKSSNVDVILKEAVDGIGVAGQIVSTRSGLAYEKLLLPQLAEYATPENVEKYQAICKEKTDNVTSPFVQSTVKFLSTLDLCIMMSKEVPWTLEKWHVRASFRKASVYVPDEAITMPSKPISGPDLSMDKKQFYVIVTINNREQVKVRCRICHYPLLDDLTGVPYWDLPCEAIFPEDQAILDSMPKHALAKKTRK